MPLPPIKGEGGNCGREAAVPRGMRRDSCGAVPGPGARGVRLSDRGEAGARS